MRVIKAMNGKDLALGNTTSHAVNDRANRLKMVKGTPMVTFEIRRPTAKKNEFHTLTDNCEIIVTDIHTAKVVTVLFPRPNQLDKYYGGKAPQWLRELALENVKARKDYA